MKKAIITSCSNRFFPSLLNLLGSLQVNFPDHPPIYVYSLDLKSTFKRELKKIPGLTVLDLPPFCSFWRSCYTWKHHIFIHPLADLNLYLDAGNQVLKPLDEIFEQIQQRDYFTVSQGGILSTIVPPEYKAILGLSDDYDQEPYITSGIFGFKKDSTVTPLLQQSYQAALAGLCLGFSQSEQRRNRGKDKTIFVRNCQTFRHDQTLLNIFLRKNLGNFFINDLDKYGGWRSPHDHPGQLIWNLRRNYTDLPYAAQPLVGHKVAKTLVLRLVVGLVNWRRKLKKLLVKI